MAAEARQHFAHQQSEDDPALHGPAVSERLRNPDALLHCHAQSMCSRTPANTMLAMP